MQSNHALALNGINGLVVQNNGAPRVEPEGDDISQRDSWRMPDEENGEAPRVLECRDREPLFNRNN